MSHNPLIYKIAVGMIPGIGSITAKKLIAYSGSVEGIFSEKKSRLIKIPGIGEVLANEIVNNKVLELAEQEYNFIEQYNIKPYFYLDENYPERLKHCQDSPIILYAKGNVNLNTQKIISIVGTRKATQHGKGVCEKLIEQLAELKHNPLIISGLAFGIDITAHKAALKNKLITVAVLGHGLRTIYPAAHSKYAKEIVDNGALVTEFTSDISADRPLFVRRNRIIAGLADATIVVESGEEGGALITADIANSYDRDVFAVPGRIDDNMSLGCNKLIKTNKAHLLENIQDLEYILGWESSKSKSKSIQKELFINLSEEEKLILETIRTNNELSIDLICHEVHMPVSKVSPMLLNLEFAGMVRSLPGKVYKVS
jgi:DNA processing protein